MAYFPFFVDLTGKEGLVVGGGAVALRKLEKLLPYGPHLTAAAPAFLPEIQMMESVTCLETPFTYTLLQGKDFVIAATDDLSLNRRIAAFCREKGILVNVVDDQESCTFLFPALVKRGELSVGISTGGASPSAAVYLKERISEALPERFGEILDYLASLREKVKLLIPEEGRRAGVFKALFTACMERGRPLEEQEMQAILEREERP